MIFVDNAESLAEACRQVDPSSWASIDTEADSLHHYREKLCLLQVSVPHHDFVIDPLAGLDLSKLLQILATKKLTLQGADFDIRILDKTYGFRPNDLFDTMIAGQLLGYERQGLADLALKHCGVTLSKKSQTADWSIRPLTKEMLEYAANDTHYLMPIREKMEEELSALGRLSWHRECCERLLKTLAEPKKEMEEDAPPRWQIKGSKALSPKALTMLRELWQWREAEAERRDRPPFKILNTELLTEIAKWVAELKTFEDVKLLPNAPRNVRGEHREKLNRVIHEALHLPPTAFTTKMPDKRFKKKWRQSDEDKLKELKVERERIAKELKITPSLLATNAMLEALVREFPKTPQAMEIAGGLMKWQMSLVAPSFLQILTQIK